MTDARVSLLMTIIIFNMREINKRKLSNLKIESLEKELKNSVC